MYNQINASKKYRSTLLFLSATSATGRWALRRHEIIVGRVVAQIS